MPFRMPHQELVARFHRRMGIPAPQQPTPLSSERAELRARLMDEEAAKSRDAVARQDTHEMIDALTDLLSVTLGAAVEMGVDLAPFFEEVHRTNMQKIPAPHGGKSIKPDGWSPPDIAGVHERWMATSRSLLRKVDCVRIPVAELDAGLAFYRDQLGHALLWRNETAAGLRWPESDAEIDLHLEPQGTDASGHAVGVSRTPSAPDRMADE
ncbi:MAG TPA: hypothetical protein VFB58_11220 [Chloroflexota bacterium]|nr:hypothetical protein [Chloroflexota bacterium]